MSKTFIEQSRLYGAVFDIVEQSKSNTISYQQVVTLESALPGIVLNTSTVRGLTEQASVENFQKVKEAVSNAISKMIERIRAFIKSIIAWFRSDGKALQDAPKVGKDIADKEKEFKQAVNNPEPNKPVHTQAPNQDISEYDPYAEQNLRENDFGERKVEFKLGLLVIDNFTTQQIIAIVRNRQATVDDVLLALLTKRIDIPLLWLTEEEQGKLLQPLVSFKWVPMAGAFKAYHASVVKFSSDGWELVNWKRAEEVAFDSDLGSIQDFAEAAEACEKLSDRYIKQDGQYYGTGGMQSENIEYSTSLYSHYHVWFRNRAELKGANTYTQPHQRVTHESIAYTISMLQNYTKPILRELADVEQCLAVLQEIDLVYKKFDIPVAKQPRFFGNSIREWVLLITMVIRTYNMVLKGFETILGRLKQYDGDLDKLIGKA